MKKRLIPLISTCLLLGSVNSVFADVYVEGYYRSDGTYVRPHMRSSPDGVKWNNYGPSQRSIELMNPHLRDYDGDGISNSYDFDDDNDGWFDDYDSNQYGR